MYIYCFSETYSGTVYWKIEVLIFDKYSPVLSEYNQLIGQSNCHGNFRPCKS